MRLFRPVLIVAAALALPLWATIDRDGDGISDIWTARYPTAGAPDADPDGDGATNRAEAIAGTDPTSVSSRLVATTQRDASGNLVLGWTGQKGKHYRIESSADLSTWTAMPGDYTGAGAALSVIVCPTGTPTGPRQFWRVAAFDVDTDGDGFNDWEEAQLGTSPTAADSDHDGMRDGAEYRWFGSLNYDGTGDTDGDGMSDAAELANGTSPYDPYNGVPAPSPPSGFMDPIPGKGLASVLGPTSWCYFLLPDGYDLVAQSVAGVAVLTKSVVSDGVTRSILSRWCWGEMDELGDGYSAIVNRRGTIAAAYGIQADPYRSLPAAKIWPLGQATPWVYIPPFVCASGYSQWYGQYWSSMENEIEPVSLDDNNTLWYRTVGSYSEESGYIRYFACAPYGGSQRLFPQFMGYRASDNGSHYYSAYASASGVPYGWELIGDSPQREIAYVENQVVDEMPYINENRTLLWSTRRILEFADGHTEPIPADGEVLWIDSADRPQGNADDRPVMWTKKANENGQPMSPVEYDRHDYIPLPTVDGWITDALVAPDSDRPAFGQATHPTRGTRNFLAIPIHAYIAVDANRDGQIKLPSDDNSDATSADKPFRFWLNDDIDRIHVADGTDAEEDDIGGTEANGLSPDWRSDTITCERDLEDFARLWINISGLTDALKGGQICVGLKWKGITDGSSPAIKLYPATDQDGGMKYLTNWQAAVAQTMTEGAVKDAAKSDSSGDPQTNPIVVPTGGDCDFILPSSLFQDFSSTKTTLHLLFEGCQPGSGQLAIVLLSKDASGTFTKIGDGPGVWLDLKEPKDFILRWTCGDADRGPVGSCVLDTTKGGVDTTPTTEEEKDLVLYVHGYNMQEFEKQRWIETTYKRLWHLGYKGRAGGFTWPCAVQGWPDIEAFDTSEERAWQAGAQLKQLLTDLKAQGKRVHVLGHSQGNVVVAEALRQWKMAGNTNALVSTYIASQAAIPAHCYDASQPERIDFTPDTPEVYGRYWNGGDQHLPETWPASSPSYLAPSRVQSAAGKFANFYNPQDWALMGNGIDSSKTDGHQPGYLINQRLKPDHSSGYWYSNLVGFEEDPLFHINPKHYAFPDDRFTIFAYCAEARSLALGTVDVGGVFSTKGVDLTSATFGFGPRHIYHSGQFRSALAARANYWNRLLIEAGLKAPE